MQPILMEDWLTLDGTGADIVQDVDRWIRSAPFQDIFFSVDVRQASGPMTFYLETAPNRDEALFQSMVFGVGGAPGFTPAVGLNYQIVRASDPSTKVPVSEWSRWRVTLGSVAGGPGLVTFRVVAHGNRLC